MVIPDLLQQAEGDRLLRTIDDELLNELTRVWILFFLCALFL